VRAFLLIAVLLLTFALFVSVQDGLQVQQQVQNKNMYGSSNTFKRVNSMVYTAFICDRSFEVQVEVADEMKRLRCCMLMHGHIRRET
jgi:hypothetical protein